MNDNRMSVLFLTNIPSPYRVAFFTELSRQCELTVVYERPSAADRHAAWHIPEGQGYRAITLNARPGGRDNALHLSVVRHLPRKRYDLVVMAQYGSPTCMLAILWLKIRNIPFVLSVDGGMPRTAENPLAARVKRFFIGGARYWLSSGSQTDRYLLHYGAVSERIHHYPFASLAQAELPDGALGPQEKAALRLSLGFDVRTLYVAVGQFIPRKGFLGLLREWTARPRPDAGLLLIGGGPEQPLYEQLAAGASNVWILPFQKKEELRRYYQASDIFVLPTHEDIWGLVVNEALAFGLPVVSTDKCVAALTFAGPSVRIVPDDQPAAFVSVMEALAAEDLVALGQDARKVVASHTIERMADTCMDALRSMLG